jgi:hypothetical protein
MGPNPVLPNPTSQRTIEAARAYFEPQLESIGLSAEQIEGQTLEELEASLINVNVAIQHPESFGSLQLSFPAKGAVKLWVVEAGAPEGQITIGALPVLLERKSMILRRIAVLRPQAQLSDLEKVVANTVEDPQERKSLLKSIEISKEEAVVHARSLQLQAEQTDQERERSMRLQVELKERTSALRRSWFERESVASIVGALLLVSLGAALIVSMFTHTLPSQIITSSFLLILGYFFGQAGSNKRKPARSNKPKSDVNT